jgi:hypothetical protein
MVGLLPSKYKGLGSNPSTVKKNMSGPRDLCEDKNYSLNPIL